MGSAKRSRATPGVRSLTPRAPFATLEVVREMDDVRHFVALSGLDQERQIENVAADRRRAAIDALGAGRPISP